jgi:hypothetical protein
MKAAIPAHFLANSPTKTRNYPRADSPKSKQTRDRKFSLLLTLIEITPDHNPKPWLNTLASNPLAVEIIDSP